MAEKRIPPLGIGLIGAGFVSEGYLKSYSEDPRTALVCIADIDEDSARKAASIYNVETVVSDYRQLIRNDRIELVVAATPHFLHPPMVMGALEHGVEPIVAAEDALYVHQIVDDVYTGG